MGFYEFMEECKRAKRSPQEALEAWDQYQERESDRWCDETGYYDRWDVIEGDIQGDLIDLYRRER